MKVPFKFDDLFVLSTDFGMIDTVGHTWFTEYMNNVYYI